ncbi:MAG TPA: RsmB/NOP family class I SAM-dependent RNA methyltransferase [Anaerolineales bacterium]|nr:RsmB/NOP family class I SAM-dependent RNA methyltransferase [Anaerolineales bacterium]
MPPTAFLEKMHRLLQAEYPAFSAEFNQSPYRGLRTNTSKISPTELQARLPFELQPVGKHCPEGFYARDIKGIGSHHYYQAGVYYSQEPAAQCVVPILDPQPGDRVIDLAAAPGGKSTHIAARLQGSGLLVTNDYHVKRVFKLMQNIERMAVPNAIVINCKIKELANRWGACFDKVLLDAPCSGEGMFRKHGEIAWSEDLVRMCAERQGELLPQAAQLVKPGGRLCYSTCTFSPEENEQVIAQFLHDHPHFSLVNIFDLPAAPAQAVPGNPAWGGEYTIPELAYTVRLYPHRFHGEGHFIALFQRAEGESSAPEWESLRPASKAAQRIWQNFLADSGLNLPSEYAIAQWGNFVMAVPDAIPDLHGIRSLLTGLPLGELRHDRLIPAHLLARASQNPPVLVRYDLQDHAIHQYLRGSDLPAPEGSHGWGVLCVDEFPLGWVKSDGRRLKNHYPQGLRVTASGTIGDWQE